MPRRAVKKSVWIHDTDAARILRLQSPELCKSSRWYSFHGPVSLHSSRGCAHHMHARLRSLAKFSNATALFWRPRSYQKFRIFALCSIIYHGFILQRLHFMETATGSDMMVILRLFSSRDSCITIQGKQQAQTTMSPVVPPSIPNMPLICRRQRMGMNGIAAHSARFIQCPASRSEQPQEATAVFRPFCAPPIPHDAFPPENRDTCFVPQHMYCPCKNRSHHSRSRRARTEHEITVEIDRISGWETHVEHAAHSRAAFKIVREHQIDPK